MADDDKPNLFNQLPDDLVVLILCNLGSSASSPSDFFNALLTCKRIFDLGFRRRPVLSKLGAKALVMKARNWSESALRFLIRCAAADNIEAYYILGMIGFYCCQRIETGKLALQTAANKSHALAAYSLAIIKFNGSGGSKADQNPHAGVDLCKRAASLGHWDAVIELGHLLYDGHRLYPDLMGGRRLFSVEQAVKLVSSVTFPFKRQARHHQDTGNEAAAERHPVDVFLKEWFESEVDEGLKLCAHEGCGRPETRVNEFERTKNYCSRSCHWRDWNLRYKAEGGGVGGGNGGAGA
ncbi:hypothetical protein V6N12_068090 [Hibiscus sabdariffa]|uniref:At2g35280-like TPR domain-containing protein n=1 Tax=Hibiscus sabdariffa TaxID=183260 RepID=A0ABR2FP45_9ROSI